jgi:glyoxalase family protein
MNGNSEKTILGIHHVTALARNPQRNVEFYTEALGLRLVKRTVNFDDPGTYHLYYGDDLGRPGTVMTFFPWPRAVQGYRGTGQTTATAFRVPAGSLGYWQERLRRLAIEHEGPGVRFSQEVLVAYDPDGLKLELVAADGGSAAQPWSDASVPAEHAIRGFAGVTLTESNLRATSRFLTGVMGFEPAGESGNRLRFVAGKGDGAAAIEVEERSGGSPGRIAAGTVHHVAWRAADDGAQREWQEGLSAAGVRVTQVRDRQYFRSIYFHEPGGVLFEIATDPPGFTVDEAPEDLGHSLRLPPWLEPRRTEVERALPALELPAGVKK